MPYIPVIVGIFNDIKVWLYSLIGVITVVVIIIQAFKYQGGEEAEKHDAIRNIKRVVMGGGVYLLAWLADYIINRMAAI